MIHWLTHAFNTYILHTEDSAGYQWWSGAGSDLMYLGVFLGVAKHINCEQPRCLRPGHRHPNHGRPVCKKHYHEDLKP